MRLKHKNLDCLVNKVVILNNFYAVPTCSPTRSMLLSRTDNHIGGLGNMAEDLTADIKGEPDYEWYLNNRVASLSQWC